MTADASRIVVTGSVFYELDGLLRRALYEVRDGALRTTLVPADGNRVGDGHARVDGSRHP
jgi:hypothetical protein